jgi:probable phosphoglycerate mutase
VQPDEDRPDERPGELPGHEWAEPLGVEGARQQLGDRADRVIERLLPTGGDVLVFSHGHFLRVLAARWIEAEPVLASRLELATATISELGWEAERRVIEGWNGSAHLAG